MENEAVSRRFHMYLCRLFLILICSLVTQMEVNSFSQFKLTCSTQETTSDQY